ncbi:MAG: hypothetical protein IT379_24345, partial [Deltaproteobacteria bacterium]|nr:hypothetical protein [Deltaproteobacteria bacterium]
VPTCSDDGDPDGDDGVLVTRGNTLLPGCSASYPSFLTFGPGGDPDGLAQQFGCVARVGTGGCGFEQQLEATLKAITPSTSTAVAPFISGTGHADGRNVGFRRADALLAIVMLTDEEDCSAQNPEIFNARSGIFPGEALNLRCFMYGAESYGAVHPVARYVNGFLAAVDGDPRGLLFAAIVGVPPDSVPNPDAIDYTAILSHPSMQEMIDPMDPNRLRTSCNVPGLGIAFPPRRIVQVAQQLSSVGLGDAAMVSSICTADLDLGTIARRIADRAGE